MPSPFRVRRVLVSSLAIMAVAAGTLPASAPEAQALDTAGYIASAVAAARQTHAVHGVPVSVTVAQSILESGWGRSGLTKGWNNYFGMKCSALISPYQTGCKALPSAEYYGGKRGVYVSRFRTYPSMANSFLDHGRLLSQADRYRPAFAFVNDPDRFIRAVHKAGYATDPRYAASVISLMKRYNLYAYDNSTNVPIPTPPTPATPPASRQQAFIDQIALVAQQNQQQFGLLASVTMAQAIQSSNWGQSALIGQTRNYFGMICGQYQSSISTGCLLVQNVKYRTYGSLAASFADRATMLMTVDRYASARQARATPSAFLNALVKAGWTSDSRYVATVLDLIATYGLQRYDVTFSAGLTSGASGATATALQYLLRARGTSLPVTGKFDAATTTAVKAFQLSAGLPATGQADPVTLTRLVPTLDRGKTGDAVTALHLLLASHQLPTTSGATFGQQTLVSVTAFQRRNPPLAVDGVVGRATWATLFR